MSKDAEGSGCSVVQYVHCGVVLAGHGAERTLSSEKKGKLGGQMLSLPLTLAGSLRNDTETQTVFLPLNDFQLCPSLSPNWRPLYF